MTCNGQTLIIFFVDKIGILNLQGCKHTIKINELSNILTHLEQNLVVSETKFLTLKNDPKNLEKQLKIIKYIKKHGSIKISDELRQTHDIINIRVDHNNFLVLVNGPRVFNTDSTTTIYIIDNSNGGTFEGILDKSLRILILSYFSNNEIKQVFTTFTNNYRLIDGIYFSYLENISINEIINNLK